MRPFLYSDPAEEAYGFVESRMSQFARKQPRTHQEQPLPQAAGRQPQAVAKGISSYALHLGADADDSNISSSASDSDCRSYTQPLPSTTVPLPNPPLPHVVDSSLPAPTPSSSRAVPGPSGEPIPAADTMPLPCFAETGRMTPREPTATARPQLAHAVPISGRRTDPPAAADGSFSAASQASEPPYTARPASAPAASLLPACAQRSSPRPRAACVSSCHAPSPMTCSPAKAASPQSAMPSCTAASGTSTAGSHADAVMQASPSAPSNTEPDAAQAVLHALLQDPQPLTFLSGAFHQHRSSFALVPPPSTRPAGYFGRLLDSWRGLFPRPSPATGARPQHAQQAAPAPASQPADIKRKPRRRRMPGRAQQPSSAPQAIPCSRSQRRHSTAAHAALPTPAAAHQPAAQPRAASASTPRASAGSGHMTAQQPASPARPAAAAPSLPAEVNAAATAVPEAVEETAAFLPSRPNNVSLTPPQAEARAASDSLPAAPTGSACPTPDLSSPCSSSLSSSGSSSLDAAPAFPPPGLCRPQRMSKVPHAAWSPRGSVEQAAEWEVRIVVGDAEWDVASKYEWRSDSEDEVDLGITRGTSSRGVIICPGSPVHAVVAPRLTGTALEAAVFSHQPNVGQWADCEENEDE